MIEKFEQIVLDEWCYIPSMALAMLGAFGLGFLVGTLWALV